MGVWDFLTITDEKGNKKTDPSKIASLGSLLYGAASGDWQRAGQFNQGFQNNRNAMLDRKQQLEAQQKDQEYQDWLRKMQEEDRRRQDEQYKNSRFQMTQEAYDALNGSPLQQMFSPTQITEQYNTAPQEVQDYVSQYTTQIKPNATKTTTNFGEVSKEDYFKALQDAESRKKEMLTWTPELWKAVENSPLAVMYAPQENTTTEYNPNMPSQEELAKLPENVRNQMIQSNTGTRVNTDYTFQNPTISKTDYMQLLQSKPQGLTPEEEAKLELYKAQTNAANANAWRDYNYFPGNGTTNDELKSKYDALLKTYDRYKSGTTSRNNPGEMSKSNTPMSMQDWLKQPAQAELLNTYNAYNGTNIQGFQYPYNRKPGTQTNQLTQSTVWFKTHSTPPNGITPQAWKDADWVVATSKGIGIQKVLVDAAQKLKDGLITQDIYNALVARSKIK